MRALVLIDPPLTLFPTTDTSIALMDEMMRRGHEVWACEMKHVGAQENQPVALAKRVVAVNREVAPALTLGTEDVFFRIDDFQTVLIRKDPPFDTTYLLVTQLLELARDRVFFFNDPRGLREYNEKLSIFRFPQHIARTVVSSSVAAIRQFLAQEMAGVVLKPLTGFGGQGILFVRPDDPNATVLLEMMTANETQPIMAQAYLPQIREGDKRILLLGGAPLGCLLRTPGGTEIRSNLRAGGRAHPTEVTEAERALCEALAPSLRALGLHFVGLDVIGGCLTEINVTSPTGLQVMNRLYQTNLEKQVVDYIEAQVQQLASVI